MICPVLRLAEVVPCRVIAGSCEAFIVCRDGGCRVNNRCSSQSIERRLLYVFTLFQRKHRLVRWKARQRSVSRAHNFLPVRGSLDLDTAAASVLAPLQGPIIRSSRGTSRTASIVSLLRPLTVLTTTPTRRQPSRPLRSYLTSPYGMSVGCLDLFLAVL